MSRDSFHLLSGVLSDYEKSRYARILENFQAMKEAGRFPY